MTARRQPLDSGRGPDQHGRLIAPSCLPPSLAPRGLSRVQAAEYIGVGPSKFDALVKDGRMPRAKRIDGRTVWDRLQIDAAFAAIGEDGEAHNEWDALG